MDIKDIKKEIDEGKAVLGIEFGSTRIKAVLVNTMHEPVASGAFDWENSLVDGIWTYSLDEVHQGIVAAFADLKKNVSEKYGVNLASIAAMGVSAMMHGYLAFDREMNLLVPFRTWRNTITQEASRILSDQFNYPVPERWSIAHLFQAMLNKEEHVSKIDFLTTLAGYAHYMLCGQKVLGVGDASGMFPIDSSSLSYDQDMVSHFDSLVEAEGYGWKLEELLPKVLCAGENAGTMTEAGAKWLDPTGELKCGCLMAPPEGDAGTGMTATNSVAPRTGNVSAGTSVFAMVVLEKPLSKTYSGKIDMVTTPDGKPCAMAHANNCTGEYDKWIKLFGEAAQLLGAQFTKDQLYAAVLGSAKNGAKDGGGLVPFNYISGESITGFSEGRPLFVRAQDAEFNLANFMRSQVYTSLGALRAGMDILFENEKVHLDSLTGHGGFFKTEDVGLPVMAGAMHTPVTVMSTAGEGGPWGMALLAAYAVAKSEGKDLPLGDWLNKEVFALAQTKTVMPLKEDEEGFNAFYARYCKALAVEKAAVENI